MTYEYECPSCYHLFPARRAVADRDQAIDCPDCGNAAYRQFNPRACFFHTNPNDQLIHNPGSLKLVKSDFYPESTPQHSGNYLQGQAIARQTDAIYAGWERQKPRKTVKEILLEKYPDTRLDQPFTRRDSEDLKATLHPGTGK